MCPTGWCGGCSSPGGWSAHRRPPLAPRGRRCVGRYDSAVGKGFSPNYGDPVLLAEHERVVRELGRRWRDDPLLAFVQLGSLGHWGEWHCWRVARGRARVHGTCSAPLSSPAAGRIHPTTEAHRGTFRRSG